MALPDLSQAPATVSSLVAGVHASTTPDGVLSVAAGNKSPDVFDAFYYQDTIDTTRWNQYFPYQLLIVEAVVSDVGDVTYKPRKEWSFTLPVAPERFNISMPFAMPISATLGGYRETNNGAPFRTITLAGTTGVLPARAFGDGSRAGVSIVESIAGGTIAALNRVQTNVEAVVTAVTGQDLQNPNMHSPADFDVQESDTSPAALLAKTTGWYQWRKLQQFLERYAAVKTTLQGRSLRLALATWKDQAVYLVQPVSIDTVKASGSPLEYNYVLSLRAWSRVPLEAGDFQIIQPTPIKSDPGVLAQVLNSLTAARRAAQSVSLVASAAIGDVNRLLFEPMRQAILLAKDLLGAALTVAEMPDQLASSMRESWAQTQDSLSSVSDAANQLSATVRAQLGLGRSLNNEIQPLTNTNSQKRRAAVVASHPALHVFNAVKQNVDLMSTIDITGLKLPAAIQKQVQEEVAAVRKLTRLDFENMRDSMETTSDRLAIALGAGNATYEATFGVTAPAIKDEPTDSDWDVLFALNSAVMAMDQLAAAAGAPVQTTSLDLMASLARRSGIAFQIPASKFAIPFPYGGTIEFLAQNYLGDPDRAIEIVALNGLREPYVDEIGFDLPLLVNASGNEVMVQADDRLYSGQTVWVSSTGGYRVKRHTMNIRTVGGNFVLTLDGPGDLALYTVNDGAKLSAFLPDTINSQQLIYIPSDREPSTDDFIVKSIPGVQEFDPMVAVGGVDLLLDSNNDLVVTPDGDCRLAIGLQNIIQNVRVALSTVQGTLLNHPGFGIPIQVGMSTADVDANQVLAAIRRMLSSDPSIARIDTARVVKNGPTVSIDIAVVVAGTAQTIPITFQLQ